MLCCASLRFASLGFPSLCCAFSQVDSRKKFQRAGVERDADDPAGQVSKSSLRKNKPGVYNKVSTKADCEVVLSLLQDKANAALGLTADGGDP